MIWKAKQNPERMSVKVNPNIQHCQMQHQNNNNKKNKTKQFCQVSFSTMITRVLVMSSSDKSEA